MAKFRKPFKIPIGGDRSRWPAVADEIAMEGVHLGRQAIQEALNRRGQRGGPRMVARVGRRRP